jgi:hypothetical protein
VMFSGIGSLCARASARAGQGLAAFVVEVVSKLN